jgi:hypothetical protein
VLDSNREFERRYNRDGWTFLMLTDGAGRVVYRVNSPREGDWQAIEGKIKEMLARGGPGGVMRDGVRYAAGTLARSGESSKGQVREVYPSVACDGAGRVYVAFTQFGEGNADVMVRVFEGGEWGEAREVAASEADEFDGRVVADGEGGVWVSWTSNGGGDKYDVYAAYLGEPAGAIEPVRLTESDDDAMHARMACDTAGRAWIVYYKWHKMGGRSRDKEVYARYLGEGGWSPEMRVSPEDVPEWEDHSDPVVVRWGEGVAVGWSWDFHLPRPKGHRGRWPESPTIFVRQISAEGGQGGIKAVSAEQIDTMPTVAAGNGRLWIAWESIDARWRKQVAVAVFGEGEAPTVGVNLSGTRANVDGPQLCAGPGGEVSLVWCESDGEKWVAKRARQGSEARAWGEPEVICGEGRPRFASGAYGGEGELWVAYSVEEAGGGRRIVVSRIGE